MPFYRATPALQEEIRKHVDEMLENDIIEPSNSIWHSPVVMVRKRSGEWRFAVDYRKLNKITVPLSFPLPHLETVFDAVGEAKPVYFSSLDLRSGFWQSKWPTVVNTKQHSLPRREYLNGKGCHLVL